MIRVGVVGADINHALEYASLISPPADAKTPMLEFPPLDPTLEASVATVRCAANTEPDQRLTLEDVASEPAIADAEVTCWWGRTRSDAEAMAARLGVDTVVDDPAQMLGQVDAVLVCTKAAAEHHALALPFVEAGIPTFVDKPFTDDAGHAAELLAAARRTDAVLFSSSPWKWSPAVASLRDSLPRLGGLRTAVASGPAPGDGFFYVSHSVELVQYVLGTGAEHVTCVDGPGHRSIVIGWSDGRLGMVNAMRDVAWVRHLVVYGVEGYLEAEVTNVHRDEGKVRMILEFMKAVRTGIPPVPLDYLQEATDVLVAAELSARDGGRRVELTELRQVRS